MGRLPFVIEAQQAKVYKACRRIVRAAPPIEEASGLARSEWPWLPGESSSPAFWPARGLRALGVWLHLTERHEHPHPHEPLAHAHYPHEHDLAWDDQAPHMLWHRHAPIPRQHPHSPDIHHRHPH